MSGVFISYAREDLAFVAHLHAALKKAEREPRWDQDHEIVPFSSPWWLEIQDAIDGSDKFVFVISPDSVESGPCARELAYAVAGGKQVIPIVRRTPAEGQEVPAALREPTWIFFTDDAEFAEKFDDLVKVLDTDLAWTKEHTRLLERSKDWSKRQDKSLLLRGTDLRAAEVWLANAGRQPLRRPTDAHSTFIQASRRAADRAARLLRGALATGMAIALALATVALIQANHALHESTIAQSEGMAAEATSLYPANAPLAMLLSLEAYDRAPTPQAGSALIDASQQPLDYLLNVGPSTVTSVATSRDGKTLATADSAGHIELWNMASGRHIATFDQGHPIVGLAFDPAGQVIVAGDSSGRIGVFEIATGRRSIINHGVPIYSLAFSSDGGLLAIGDEEGNIYLTNLSSGATAVLPDGYHPKNPSKGITVNPDSDPIDTLAFSPDDKTLAAGDFLGNVQLWDVSSHRRTATLSVGPAVESVAFSRDDVTIAAAGFSDDVYLYNARTGKEDGTLAEGSPVESVAFSPSGETIAAGISDGSIGLWSAASRRLTGTLSEGSFVNSVAFSPDGKTLVAGADGGQVGLWNVSATAPGATFSTGTGTPVTAAAFSRDGTVVAAADLRGAVGLWDVATGRRTALFPNLGEAYSVAFSPHGTTLAVGDLLGVELWNTATSKLITTLAEGGDGSNSVAFSPDGQVIAAGDQDGGLGLWSTASHKRTYALDVGATVNSVAFSPDGTIVAVGDHGDRVGLWDVKDGKRIAELTEGGAVNSVAFSPHGQMLAAGDQSGHIGLWDIASGRRLATLDEASPVTGVAFSPVSGVLVSGDSLGDVTTWDVATDQQIDRVAEGSTSITDVAFSPNGRAVAAAEYGGAVTLLTRGISTIDQALLTQLICGEVRENMTQAQWIENAPGQPYQKTCPAYS